MSSTMLSTPWRAAVRGGVQSSLSRVTVKVCLDWFVPGMHMEWGIGSDAMPGRQHPFVGYPGA